jgi:hypothetical protein
MSLKFLGDCALRPPEVSSDRNLPQAVLASQVFRVSLRRLWLRCRLSFAAADLHGTLSSADLSAAASTLCRVLPAGLSRDIHSSERAHAGTTEKGASRGAPNQ